MNKKKRPTFPFLPNKLQRSSNLHIYLELLPVFKVGIGMFFLTVPFEFGEPKKVQKNRAV